MQGTTGRSQINSNEIIIQAASGSYELSDAFGSTQRNQWTVWPPPDNGILDMARLKDSWTPLCSQVLCVISSANLLHPYWNFGLGLGLGYFARSSGHPGDKCSGHGQG